MREAQEALPLAANPQPAQPLFNLRSPRGSLGLGGPNPPLRINSTCSASRNAGVKSSSAPAVRHRHRWIDPSFSSTSTHHSAPSPLPVTCRCCGSRLGAGAPGTGHTRPPWRKLPDPHCQQQHHGRTPQFSSHRRAELCPHTKPQRGHRQGDRDGWRMLPEPGFKPA